MVAYVIAVPPSASADGGTSARAAAELSRALVEPCVRATPTTLVLALASGSTVKVNGKDVSNSTHEETVKAFELAEEPIIIEVLRRSISSAPAALADTPIQIADTDDSVTASAHADTVTEPTAQLQQLQQRQQATLPVGLAAYSSIDRLPTAATMVSVSTQTDMLNLRDILPSGPTEAGLPSPPPLAAYEWPPKGQEPSEDCSRKLQADSVADNRNRCPAPALATVVEQEPDELLYLSVTLRRQAASHRLGLTLCYGPPDQSGVTDVFIGEVEPDGIAAGDGRLMEGDQILQVNGEDVLNRETAVRLLSASAADITLLVCRPNSQWGDDDGFAEDQEVLLNSLGQESKSCSAMSAEQQKVACIGINQKGNTFTVAFAKGGLQFPKESTSGAHCDSGDCHEPLTEDYFGTETYLSTCGEEEEDEEEGTQVANGHEISEEHCRRFVQALQLKCEALCNQPAVPAANHQTTRPPQPRLGTMPLVSAAANSSALSHMACDKRQPQPWRSAPEDSSSHDTAYNTAESCRSSSAAQDAPLPAQPCSAGTSPRLLHAERCRTLRAQPVCEDTRAPVEGSMMNRRSAVRADSRLTANGGCDTDVMYTDERNLAHVMALQQQRLLEERLAAGKDGRQDKHATSSGNRASSGASASGALEWVVKVRSDGSRYVARRPARARLLKDRQRRLEDERCGLTTDDDAASELKLGRRWSNAERKRHMESAREHRNRKELMRLAVAQKQQKRGAADEHAAAGNKAVDIVELSHRRQLRQQLADIDFTTVQELLVHGSRGSPSANCGKVLLSVTTV